MVIEYRDATWWQKLNGGLRRAVIKGAINPIASPVVLTEYPKCGGTWLSQMLSAALEIPYPRNRLPTMGDQVIHGCYLNVHPKLDTVVVWRDGRDCMVSYYYHLFTEKPAYTSRMMDGLICDLKIEDPYDIKTNMPRFIDWTFTGGYPRFSWSHFVQCWAHRDDIVQTRYEAMKLDAVGELERILKDFDRKPVRTREELATIVDSYSFEKQAKRKPGEENIHSYIRKGIVGDWKNVFDLETRRQFHRYAGAELITLGYEQDDSWVENPT